MRDISEFENRIYNDGERLIPGVTHNFDEVIRHKSTYSFFKKIIEMDISKRKLGAPIKIIDLGCGVGHGCYTLAQIPGAQVSGVDMSEESIEYAKNNYQKDNISYQVVNLIEYISTMPEYEYVVSRHAFEHIHNGLKVALFSKWSKRLMFEVPYAEPEGNPYHLLINIREENFADFPNREIFFQDLDGLICNEQTKPIDPNGIICISNSSDSSKIEDDQIKFPLLPPIRLDSIETEQFINEHHNLMQELQNLQQQHQELQQQHQELQQQHQELQNSKAVTFTNKLAEYPMLMKLTSILYRILAKVYSLFTRGKRDAI